MAVYCLSLPFGRLLPVVRCGNHPERHSQHSGIPPSTTCTQPWLSLKALNEPLQIDDRAAMSSFTGIPAFIPTFHLEHQRLSLDGGEFGVRRNLHPDRCRGDWIPTVRCAVERNGRSPSMQACSMNPIITAAASTGGMSAKPNQLDATWEPCQVEPALQFCRLFIVGVSRCEVLLDDAA